ncbi:HAD-IA family hydrolase [Ferrimicrobium sp.]|uniref:HAD-IA family hydrolase n=1 Tax=Ferrimicrobium sp. TaxID=2926050 RepID=UPI00262E455D|nr:HAD-IA family hydrolase [Ferrimicrobium sp.]
MTLEAVFFDVDGTMAETEREGHRVAYNAAFAELGYPVHWDPELYGELLAVMGGKERIQHYWAQHPELPLLSDAQVERIHSVKARHFSELMEHGGIGLRVGVRRLLDELNERKIPVSIASTITLEGLDALLRHNLGAQWRDRFRFLGVGDVVPVKKPDPAIYRWLLEQHGVDPRSVVTLEDTRAGLLASVGAGIATLVTPSDYTRDQDFSEAACVASSLGDPGDPARWRLASGVEGSGLIDVGFLEKLIAN